MSFDVKQSGKAWRVRVRIHGYPVKSVPRDTYREAHHWAVITHGEYLSEIKTGKHSASKSVNLLAEHIPATSKQVVGNTLISSILKQY